MFRLETMFHSEFLYVKLNIKFIQGKKYCVSLAKMNSKILLKIEFKFIKKISTDLYKYTHIYIYIKPSNTVISEKIMVQI